MAHSGPLAKQQRCIFFWKGGLVQWLLRRHFLPVRTFSLYTEKTRVCSVQLKWEGSSDLWLWCQLQRQEGYPGAILSAPHLLFKQGSDQWAHSGSNGWGLCLSAMWMLLRDLRCPSLAFTGGPPAQSSPGLDHHSLKRKLLCSDVTHGGDVPLKEPS